MEAMSHDFELCISLKGYHFTGASRVTSAEGPFAGCWQSGELHTVCMKHLLHSSIVFLLLNRNVQ